MGWRKIANVQKGKIVNCHSGQIVDLHSFFPIVEGNFMVLGSVASARADGIVTGGLRAVVEDLGNYTYRSWVQACSTYSEFDGTRYSIFLNSGETRHLGYHVNSRGFGFSWAINQTGYSYNWNGQIRFWSDVLGNLVVATPNTNKNRAGYSTFLNNFYTYDTNYYVHNGSDIPIKCNFSPFTINWLNVEGIVQLYIQQTEN